MPQPNPSNLWRVGYEAESAWGESSALSSPVELPITNFATPSLSHPKQDIGATLRYMNDGAQDIRMPMGGTFTTEMLLTGLGSTAAGAIVANDLVTLLGYVLGNTDVTGTGGTSSADWTDSSSSGSVLSAQLVKAGGLARAGVIGDGRGGGQAFATSGSTSSTVTLLTALDAAPISTDQLYTMAQVYPDESMPSASLTGLRFILASANEQYICRGCWAQSMSVSGLNPGELPKLSITWGVSGWGHTSGEFPGSTEPTFHAGAPASGGSFFAADVGTSTRTTYDARDISLTIDLSTQPLMGPGGNDQYQSITGCVRTKCQASMSFTLDAEATGTHTWNDWFDTDENSATNKHILYTISATDGRAVAVYLPNAKSVGERPRQSDVQGLNRVQVQVKALTGATTSTALTLSNFRLGIG